MKPTLLIIPKLFHGGAETQFRLLFSNLYNKKEPIYLLALDRSDDNAQTKKFRNDYQDNIHEFSLLSKNWILKKIQIFIYLFFYIFYIRIKTNIKKSLSLRVLAFCWCRFLGYLDFM